MPYMASVIIPVYNAEKTLRRCVESIALGQERNVEIILVDDCSTDESWNLCRELEKEFPNVCPVQNEKNSGVSFTRNHGLNAAHGDYILFVDSDDWVSEWFAAKLTALARRNPQSLVIAGHHFIDMIHTEERDYLWNEEKDGVHSLSIHSLFDLADHFLLQQIWNKIFVRALIEQHHIRFDETQSMGEDFQFVLDYITAAGIQNFAVYNKPLYYYIRWGQNSLMSTFGLVQNQQEYSRLEQMRTLCGADSEQRYQSALAQLKQNYVYHIARNPKYSRQEKKQYMIQAVGAGQAEALYRRQRVLMFKEGIAHTLAQINRFPARISSRIKRKQREKDLLQLRNSVHLEDVSILSQNCVGGVFYHDMGAQFLSPTINLFICQPDFVKMVLNLRHYMELEPVMRWEETCPVGTLDDIEITFTHYMTCQQAHDDWQRRKKRLNYQKILVLSTDRDGFDDRVYEQWKSIPYARLLFTANPHYQDHAVFFPEFQAAGTTDNLIDGKKFYKDGRLLQELSHISAETTTDRKR